MVPSFEFLQTQQNIKISAIRKGYRTGYRSEVVKRLCTIWLMHKLGANVCVKLQRCTS